MTEVIYDFESHKQQKQHIKERNAKIKFALAYYGTKLLIKGVEVTLAGLSLASIVWIVSLPINPIFQIIGAVACYVFFIRMLISLLM